MLNLTGQKRMAGTLIVGWVLIVPRVLLALEPPVPGELEKYAKDGSLAQRIENGIQLGNHRTDPRLIWNLQRKLLKAAGQTDNQIASVIGLAPPPAWQGGLPSTGTAKTFVLLVDFPDYPHAVTDTVADVQNKFFGNGDAGQYPYESLRNYYQRSSYSQLTIQGTVFDWYRAQHNRSYYEGLGFGPGEEALMMEALNYWDAQGHDFTQYDNDGDGTIDAFFTKWTGPDNGWANFWWAYQWVWHSNPSYRLDGKALGKYVWSWIWNQYYDGRTIYQAHVDIHESGHLLGLPDLYDYDGSVGPDGGVGGLDMMDSNWGDHNCFSKYMLGWLTPTEVLSGLQTITLNPSGTSQNCVLVMCGITPGTMFGEFFMAQYRKRSAGNDPSNYPTDGLVVWHVDSTLDGSGYGFLWDNSYTSHKYLRLWRPTGWSRSNRATEPTRVIIMSPAGRSATAPRRTAARTPAWRPASPSIKSPLPAAP
jgi:M6 family metalloprotease-like protein